MFFTGDLSPEHVLSDTDGTVTGIIDLGDVAVGDAAWGFVYLYAHYGTEFLDFAAIAYAPASPVDFVDRLFHLYELDLIEWALEALDEGYEHVGEALSALNGLAADHGNLSAELDDALRVGSRADRQRRKATDPSA